MPYSLGRTPVLAFGLSVLGGILVLLWAVVIGSDRHLAPMVPVALVSTAVVLVAATSLLIVPRIHETSGIAILLGSAVASSAGGGLYLGALGVALGIAGGILAVEWKPDSVVATAIVS